MKKRTLIVRIIAGILIFIMALGMIVPYISAAEITDNIQTQDETTVEAESDAVDESEDEGEEDEDDPTKPITSLPKGFSYKKVGGVWTIVKDSSNTDAAFMLDGIPYGFDVTEITFFIGNLETYKVEECKLHIAFNYVSSISLPEGYYVVFSNNYSWRDSSGKPYELNGGVYKYIYVGENCDQSKYGVRFDTTQEIFSLGVSTPSSDTQIINYGATLLVTDSDKIYPEDAKLKEVIALRPPLEDEKRPTDKPQDTVQADEKKEENVSILKDLFSGILSKSLGLIIIISVCGIVLSIIKIKKKISAQKQSERDANDKTRIG